MLDLVDLNKLGVSPALPDRELGVVFLDDGFTGLIQVQELQPEEVLFGSVSGKCLWTLM